MKMENVLFDLQFTTPKASNIFAKSNPAQIPENSFNSYLKQSINTSERNAQKQPESKPVKKEADVVINSKPFAQKISNKSEKTLNSKDVESVDEKSSEVPSDVAIKVENAEKVIDATAKLIGISTDELKQILSMLNLTPISFVEPDLVQASVLKLSNALNLDTQQGELLNGFVKEVNQLISQSNLQSNQTTLDKSDWVKVEGVKFDIEVNPKVENVEMDVDKLVNTFKNKNALFADTLKLKASDIISSVNVKNLDILQPQVMELRINNKFEKQTTIHAENIETEGSTESLPQIIKPIESDLKKEAQLNNNVLNSNALLDVQKPNETISKIDFLSNVKVVKNEIMNQFVEKAKVMLDGQKSEMVMELRPESLGKLSLKVVTENGIVMAKIVAENQQVKDVLESNMQTLKDSLQKHGMNIGQFSVSVGQYSQDQSEAQKQLMNQPSKRVTKENSLDGESLFVDKVVDNRLINQYNQSDSKIDYRA